MGEGTGALPPIRLLHPPPTGGPNALPLRDLSGGREQIVTGIRKLAVDSGRGGVSGLPVTQVLPEERPDSISPVPKGEGPGGTLNVARVRGHPPPCGHS